jgi:hypothetical protein
MLDKRRPYDHYSNGSSGGGNDNASSQCTLYGEPEERSTAKAQMEAKKALEEYLRENPDLQGLIKKPGIKRKLDELLGPGVSDTI